MLELSLCRYSTRSQMALDIILQRTNTGQKSLICLDPKTWSKLKPNIKNDRATVFFLHALKKDSLTHPRT